MNLNLKSPPHSEALERQVLGTCLVFPDKLSEVCAQLDPECFFLPKHRRLFDWMRTTVVAGELVNIASPPAGIEPDEVSRFLDDAWEVGLPDACRRIRLDWQRRELIRSAETFLTECRLPDSEIQRLVDEHHGRIIDILDEQASPLITLRQSLASAIEAIVTAKTSGKAAGLPTHIGKLNDTIGGFRPKCLITLAARPGLGKTALAVNFTHHLLFAGYKILFISAEMSHEEISTRLLSIQSKISGDLLINRPNYISQPQQDRLFEAAEDLTRDNCLLIDQPSVSASKLFMLAQQAKAKMSGLDIVVIDYLQLLETDGPASVPRHEKVAKVTRQAKALAKRFKIPVLALSQISREGDDNPSLSTLAESDQLGRESDVVMVLREKEGHKLEVKKNRNGQTGVISLYFNPELMFFGEMV